MMFEFEQVSHTYNKVKSVHNISLTIQAGEVVTLLGPSGCGKTTLLRLAAGLETPSQGIVRMDGNVISSPQFLLPPEQRGIGLVFQSYALFPHLTVIDNVTFGLKKKTSEAVRKALNLLAELDLEHCADSYPHELSGGQQQRVALARALAPNPALILLDEPFSGLDSRLRERVRDQMLHVLRERGTAALMVTHDAEEAMFMSDRIMVLKNGREEQQGRPIDLYCRPQTGFVAEFFGEVNKFTGTVQNGKIETIFGYIPAPELADGMPADIVVRYEGLLVTPNRDGVKAYVMESHLLGRTSLVHMSVPTSTEILHLHARIPGLNSLEPGTEVWLDMDHEQTFIFEGQL